jgi:hypothetical protein
VNDIVELILKTYGIAGILLLMPFIAVVVLFKENKSLHADVLAAQVKRVEDAQAISTKLIEIVSNQSALNKETNLALDKISETMVHCNARR